MPGISTHITSGQIAAGQKYHVTLEERLALAEIDSYLPLINANASNIYNVGVLSGNWNSVFSTVLANCAQWDESADLSVLSAAIDTNTSSISGLSGDYVNADNLDIVFAPTEGYTEIDNTLSGHLSGMANALVPGYGLTASRPATPTNGEMYFDTTLGYPIWYDGAGWVDATGTGV